MDSGRSEQKPGFASGSEFYKLKWTLGLRYDVNVQWLNVAINDTFCMNLFQ